MTNSTSQSPVNFDMLTSFMLVENINSFQKLYFLLCLYERQLSARTRQDLAKQLHLGDTALLEQIITELKAVGLLTCTEECYELSDDPRMRQHLQHLATAFADPLTRQAILHQVQNQSPVSRVARKVLDRYH